jgi:hypothetical protein
LKTIKGNQMHPESGVGGVEVEPSSLP